MKKIIYIAIAFVALAGTQACMDNRKAKNYNERTHSDDDGIAFIKNSLQSGAAEIKLSQLALKNSQNQQVKNFANMMITDHTAVGNQIKEIAGKEMVNTPDSLTIEHQAILDSLSKKTGPAFDKDYMQVMVGDHEKAIEVFKRGTANTDQKIKGLAEKTIPKLQQHLKEANALCSGLK